MGQQAIECHAKLFSEVTGLRWWLYPVPIESPTALHFEGSPLRVSPTRTAVPGALETCSRRWSTTRRGKIRLYPVDDPIAPVGVRLLEHWWKANQVEFALIVVRGVEASQGFLQGFASKRKGARCPEVLWDR